MARVSDAHLEARRHSILVAATKVFTQKGIAAATMAEIASEAGISPGAIYRYFENKEQLARGCMNESAEAIKNAWSDPSGIEMSFNELARLTFAKLMEPEDTIDTQMFLEQLLIGVRDGDEAAMEAFRAEHESVRDGIAFLMRRQFGERLAAFDVERLGEALYAFYWGSRLVKLMYPPTDPVALFGQVETMMNHALGVEDEATS